MPLYWRYSLGHFFKLFCCCTAALLALLFLTRFHEATQLFALGADLTAFGLFILYQLPYILPIAIPSSALIASYLTLHQLSGNGSIMALRSLGFSFTRICQPIFAASFFLALANFYLVSEAACNCHLATKKLIQTVTLQNPHLLLKKGTLLARKGHFVQHKVVPLIVGVSIKTGPLLYMMDSFSWCDQGLSIREGWIIGVHKNSKEGFDTLLIERDRKSTLLLSPLQSQWLIKEAKVLLKPDHLNARLLIAKWQEGKSGNERTCCISELIRRVGFLFLPITMTYLGCALGAFTGRERPLLPLFLAIMSTVLILAGFFISKHALSQPLVVALCYLLPQFLALFIAKIRFGQLTRGVA